MKVLTIPVEKKEYVKTYLRVLNGILKLTDKELEILTIFLQVNHKDPCTSEFKADVIARANLKNVAVLNNYIKKFKDMGLLIYKAGIYSYNPVLNPEQYIEGVYIKFSYE